MDKLIIIDEFYQTVSKILQYEETQEINELTKKILSYICKIYQDEANFQSYLQMVLLARCMKTLDETRFLNIEEKRNDTLTKVLKIKAKYINDECVDKQTIFEKISFIEHLSKQAFRGDTLCCKLLAMMNLLGLFIEQDEISAINIYKILAFNGDIFSMKVLSQIYKDLNQEDTSKIWLEAETIVSGSLKKLQPYLTDANKDYSDEAVRISQIILSVINRSGKCKKDFMDITLLYYLASTKQSFHQLIKEICNSDTNGYVLLVKESIFKNKKYGF